MTLKWVRRLGELTALPDGFLLPKTDFSGEKV